MFPSSQASADDNDKGAEIAEVDEPIDETAFDLRGPLPRVGFKVRERITIIGVCTSEFHKPKAKSVTIKTDITKELENIHTVTAVAGDEVVEYTIEVIADHLTSSFVGLDFKRRTSEKLNDLIEQTITASKQGQIWNHELRGHNPTKKSESPFYNWSHGSRTESRFRAKSNSPAARGPSTRHISGNCSAAALEPFPAV